MGFLKEETNLSKEDAVPKITFHTFLQQNEIHLHIVDSTIILLNRLYFLTHLMSHLRWDGSHSAEVNENINLGYSQDQGYSGLGLALWQPHFA